MEDYAKEVRDNVAEHGFHVTYVAADDSPSFCYSTGIWKTFSIPELFISSLPPNLSHELIHQYLKRHAESGPPINQRVAAVHERFDYFLIPVPNAKLFDYTLASFKFYGESDFECLQLVYPDPDFLFPDEAGYDYDQEILGTYPPDRAAYQSREPEHSFTRQLKSKSSVRARLRQTFPA